MGDEKNEAHKIQIVHRDKPDVPVLELASSPLPLEHEIRRCYVFRVVVTVARRRYVVLSESIHLLRAKHLSF